LAALPVAAATMMAKKQIDSSSYFKEALAEEGQSNKAASRKDISLYLDEVWLEKKKMAADTAVKDQADRSDKNTVLVDNHSFEKKRLAADHDLQEINDQRKKDLLEDPYIKMAYQLLTVMGK
jgi:hypothetical protein